MYHGNINERQARELHMVGKEEAKENYSQQTRASDLQIHSRPFSSRAMVTASIH